MSIHDWAVACNASSLRSLQEIQTAGLISGFTAVRFSCRATLLLFSDFACLAKYGFLNWSHSCDVQVGAYAAASACGAFWLFFVLKRNRFVPMQFQYPQTHGKISFFRLNGLFTLAGNRKRWRCSGLESKSSYLLLFSEIFAAQ